MLVASKNCLRAFQFLVMYSLTYFKIYQIFVRLLMKHLIIKSFIFRLLVTGVLPMGFLVYFNTKIFMVSARNNSTLQLQVICMLTELQLPSSKALNYKKRLLRAKNPLPILQPIGYEILWD
jgi:hypothetical protein